MRTYLIPEQKYLWTNVDFSCGEWLIADRRQEKDNAQMLQDYLHDLRIFFTKRLAAINRQKVLTEAEILHLESLFKKIIETKRLIEKEQGLGKLGE